MPDESPYVLKALRRFKAGAIRPTPGRMLQSDSLREAANLTRLGHVRPADERTQRDVELFLRLQALEVKP
jgi:hypothetical protein